MNRHLASSRHKRPEANRRRQLLEIMEGKHAKELTQLIEAVYELMDPETQQLWNDWTAEEGWGTPTRPTPKGTEKQ